ncbi:hypothetical protein [Actinotalea sp. C106]|uniref:hypothetical protein n=1 Tax=Actinotalea sp. C106 TaxID=2908644 RepID=UPI002028F66A|nr:hypothetical protein [Actinotalea sp. C106]
MTDPSSPQRGATADLDEQVTAPRPPVDAPAATALDDEPSQQEPAGPARSWTPVDDAAGDEVEVTTPGAEPEPSAPATVRHAPETDPTTHPSPPPGTESTSTAAQGPVAADLPAADEASVLGTPPARRRTDGRAEPAHSTRSGRPVGRRIALALLVLVTLALVALAVHLYRTSEAWEDRSADYLEAAEVIGEDLAANRAELTGTRAELEAVRSQLGTAQERIVELADEKAQLGDDREAQRQLVDYQQRVSEAAGQVALALDQCVQGQQELIGYLADAEEYDPDALTAFESDVEVLCQAATEANIALQRELGR